MLLTARLITRIMTKIKHLQLGQNIEELREWDESVIVENNLRVYTQQSAYVCANEILLKQGEH